MEDDDEMTSNQKLTFKVWKAIFKIVEYHWGDEYRDYFSRTPEQRRGHIFESIRMVSHWLTDGPPAQSNGRDK